jgi:hypothetical protein
MKYPELFIALDRAEKKPIDIAWALSRVLQAIDYKGYANVPITGPSGAMLMCALACSTNMRGWLLTQEQLAQFNHIITAAAARFGELSRNSQLVSQLVEKLNECPF